MTIELPDEMREELEREAKAEGFATVDDYVANMLQFERANHRLPEPSADARYSVRTREELETKLLEGMDRAGDVVEDSAFWEKRKRAAELRARGNCPQ